MKKITSLALAALLAVSLSYAVSAEAVSTDIKNGTPVLDGELDEIYTQSASYKLDNFGFYTWGDGSADNTSDATAYFLWDSDYVYICVVADDKTPSSAKDAGDNNWQNDAAELWFYDDDMTFKIHAAGDGNFFLGGDKDGAVAWDKGFEASKHSAKMTDKALSMSDEEIHDVWAKAYAGQEFIVLLEPGTLPATANVVGSNAAHVQVVTDRHAGRLIAFAAIDNLNRGTAGQAVQSLNVALGLPEDKGLTKIGVAP